MKQPTKVIDHNEFAFTARCNCQTELQLGFGNIALLMSNRAFLGLKKHVETTLEQSTIECCPYCKNILVQTSVDRMTFMFSYYELTLLQEVMQNTATMLEVEGILHNIG